MNIREIDLNLLVYLNAIFEYGTVSKAAEKLEISQPALSNALNRLRKQMNDPLLIRTSRGMEPTELSLELMGPLGGCLADLNRVLAPKVRFDPAESERVFTIAGTDYSDHLILPAVLKRIQKEAPNITVSSIRVLDGTMDAVERGKIDAMIYTFDHNLSDAFHAVDLFEDGFTAVVREGHPCLSVCKEKKLSLEQYLAYGHVMITKTGIGKGTADKLLEQIGLERKTVINVRQTSLSPVSLVLDTDLIATVPMKTARYFEDMLPIRLLRLPFELPSFPVTLAWGPLAHNNQSHQWFRRLVIDETRKHIRANV